MIETKTAQNEAIAIYYPRPIIKEVYLDGILKDGDSVCGKEGSFGMFMHSLVLSSTSDDISPAIITPDYSDNLYEVAANEYIKKNGFSSDIIVSVTPKLTDIVLDEITDIKLGAYLINGRMRIVGMGTAKEVLKYCSHLIMDSSVVKLTRKLAYKACTAMEYMMNKGLNVYAIALKDMNLLSSQAERPQIRDGFALLALVGV